VAGIGQVRRHHILKGLEHRFPAAWKLLVPFFEHGFDHFSLQVGLAAAKVAGDDGKLLDLGVTFEIFFLAVGQRADHDVLAVVADKLGRHRLELSPVKHVEEQRFEQIISVVPKGNLGASQLVGCGIQNPPAQSRTQAAGGFSLRNQAFYNAVSVAFDDFVRYTETLEVGWKDVGRKAGLFLVEVDGQQFKVNRCVALQAHQDIEQPVAVLSSRNAHHDFVAFLDHAEIVDGIANPMA